MTPEAWGAIGIIATAVNTLLGIIYVVMRGRTERRTKRAEASAQEAKDAAATNEKQLNVMADIVLLLKENNEQARIDREEAKQSTQQFTAVMRDNAAAKTKLSEAIEHNSTRLSEMSASLDANTRTLNQATERVNENAANVESVVSTLQEVVTRLTTLEGKFDARDESDRQQFHNATEQLYEAIKLVQSLQPAPPSAEPPNVVGEIGPESKPESSEDKTEASA
jgi:methyl-accepting chemotaxis protein